MLRTAFILLAVTLALWAVSQHPVVHTLELPRPAWSIYGQDGSFCIEDRDTIAFRFGPLPRWADSPREVLARIEMGHRVEPNPPPQRGGMIVHLRLRHLAGLLVLFMLLQVGWLGLRIVRRSRAGRCESCGYSIRELAEPRCPECGFRGPARLAALDCEVGRRLGRGSLALALAACVMVVSCRHALLRLNPPGTLAEAALWGSERDVLRFIEAGAAINDTDVHGATALHYAAAGYPRIVRRLIDAGAAVSPPDHYGEAPLSYALRWSDRESARVLIRHGAEVVPQHRWSRGPLDTLLANRDYELPAVILEAQPQLKRPDFRNRGLARSSTEGA